MQVQVASTQWILIVELQQFHNLYNAEMKSEKVCCCDSSELCVLQAADLQGCEGYCDIWLSADVSHCTQPYPCSFSTWVYYDTSLMDNLKDKFIFGLSSFPDRVSVKRECLEIKHVKIVFNLVRPLQTR